MGQDSKVGEIAQSCFSDVRESSLVENSRNGVRRTLGRQISHVLCGNDSVISNIPVSNERHDLRDREDNG